MDTAELYPTIRRRLLALADDLSTDDAQLLVPALPGWRVKDAYAHLSGLCADVIEGRMEGAGTPSWTEKQVTDRAADSLSEVCAEWELRGPDLDHWLDEAREQGPAFVGYDTWTHHQDIRAAVGLPGERDRDQVEFLVDSALAAFDRRFRDGSAPALRVVTENRERTLGAGTPSGTLSTTNYEALRIMFGRRSKAQITAARWDGDPTPYVEHLHLFELPRFDLVD